MELTLQQFGIDRLSASERIELIGQIWDSLSQSIDDQPIPDWHIRELERRRAEADANPEAAIPWDAVRARLAERP